MLMPRSADLSMSYAVSAAIDAAVRASISTPVGPGRRGVRGDAQGARLAVGRDLDADVGQRDRMAERDELGGPLGAHDPGELGDCEHVALRRVAVDDEREGLLVHDDERLGDGAAGRRRLVADVDHPRAGPCGPRE